MKTSLRSFCMRVLCCGVTASVISAGVTLRGLAADAETASSPPETVAQVAPDQFTLALWRATCASRENENVAISPYGAEIALGMMGAGAAGETEREIASVLNKRGSWKDYAAERRLPLETNDPLVTATSLWMPVGQSFLAAFVATAKDNFGAAVEQADFAGNPLATAQRINDWGKVATRGKIPSLLEKVGETTRCVVVSAVHFAADWKTPFDPDSTAEGTFTLLDGTETRTQIMSQTSALRYGENDDVQILEMQYKNAPYSMLLLLPKKSDDFTRLEKEVTPEHLAACLGLLAETPVAVLLPRFNTESDLVLNAPLSEIGIRSAWTRGADFSRINGLHDLYLSEVRQKVFVKIDELGTEAAATTSAVIAVKSASPDTKAFYANRPFWYAIIRRDTENNAWFIFLGRFVKPEEQPAPAVFAPVRNPSLSGEGGEFN